MGASLNQGGARGGRRRNRRQRMAEINVTPFVDVMLVLLIVFMVAAPLLATGVPVTLPEASSAPLPSEQRIPLTVNIDSAGGVFVQGDPSSVATVTADVSRLIDTGEVSDRIYLRADGAVGYGAVMAVMGELNAAGYRDIGLVTRPGGQQGIPVGGQ